MDNWAPKQALKHSTVFKVLAKGSKGIWERVASKAGRKAGECGARKCKEGEGNPRRRTCMEAPVAAAN